MEVPERVKNGNWDILCLSEDVCTLVFTAGIETTALSIFAEVM